MMKSVAAANSTAGGYCVTPNQPAIVLRPSRQSDSASMTTPVRSHRRAYRSRSLRRRINSKTIASRTTAASAPRMDTRQGVISIVLLEWGDVAAEQPDEDRERHL